MARLFMIGNGFDFAHGYKTKYSQFRDWMLEELSKLGSDKEKMDEVLEILFSVMGNHEEEYDRKDLLKFVRDSICFAPSCFIHSTGKAFIDDLSPMFAANFMSDFIMR